MGPCPRAFQFTKYASSGFSRVAHSKTTKGREKWKINKKKGKHEAENRKQKKEENRQERKVDARGILSTLESDFSGLEIMD